MAGALADGFEHAGIRVDECPLADGGEGTLDALRAALALEPVRVDAHDALGRQLEVEIGVTRDGGVAVVETASAIGVGRIDAAQRDPEGATSRGAGELIAAAARRAPTVVVGLGGSATTDGGLGALQAIDESGLGRGSGAATARPGRLVCLCDVATPWERAAALYAPQKGADGAAVGRLAARLESLASSLPRDPRGVALTGAAGGLAGGLWAGLGAELVPGAAYVCDAVGFDERARAAGAVVTGEGRLDATTLEGKAVAEVARRCKRLGVPLHAVVGADASSDSVREALGLASVAVAGDAAAITAAAAHLAAPGTPNVPQHRL